jgi:hypothetical protein
VGVSLCDAEASVAAPLTSRRASIACLLPVMYEGRASLEAAYAIFSYIIAYAFIQVHLYFSRSPRTFSLCDKSMSLLQSR